MLLTRATAALERLRKAEAARSGLEEAEALDRLQKDFADRVRPLLVVCERVRMLRGEGVSISPPTDVQKSLQTLVQTTARFKERPASTTLKQGKRWTNLLDAVDTLRRTCEASLHNDWTTYANSQLFSAQSPEELSGILAKTPQNTAQLHSYMEIFRKYASARAMIPATANALAELREYSRQLSEMRFERDVPDDVRAFFEAAATPTGAALALLTPEVVAWLRKNGHIANFVVRARMN